MTKVRGKARRAHVSFHHSTLTRSVHGAHVIVWRLQTSQFIHEMLIGDEMKFAIQMLVGVACAASAIAHAGEPTDEQDANLIERRAHFAAPERRVCEQLIKGELFARTELLFGLSRSGGPDITEEEFQGFIDLEVTERFPEGLTLLTGNGQFRDSAGNIVQEGSKLLILLYPFNKNRSALVDEVRNAYKSAFQQESVLRVDEHSCVSF